MGTPIRQKSSTVAESPSSTFGKIFEVDSMATIGDRDRHGQQLLVRLEVGVGRQPRPSRLRLIDHLNGFHHAMAVVPAGYARDAMA